MLVILRVLEYFTGWKSNCVDLFLPILNQGPITALKLAVLVGLLDSKIGEKRATVQDFFACSKKNTLITLLVDNAP